MCENHLSALQGNGGGGEAGGHFMVVFLCLFWAEGSSLSNASSAQLAYQVTYLTAEPF